MEKTAETGDADHRCQCGLFGPFGFARRWFCEAHVPAEFWNFPGSRRAAALRAEIADRAAEPTLALPLMTGKAR